MGHTKKKEAVGSGRKERVKISGEKSGWVGMKEAEKRERLWELPGAHTLKTVDKRIWWKMRLPLGLLVVY